MLRRTLLCFGAATLCAAHLSSSISLTRRGAMLSAAAAASASTVVVDSNAEDSAPREVMTNVDVATGPGNKPVMVSRRRFTGAGDQGWTFPQTDLASSVLAQPFPNEWPYTDADFKRIDEEPDTAFYKFPKLVYHIDEGAVAALTRYYASNIPAGSDVLDICSSWVSHYPRGIGAFAGDDEDFKSKMKSIQATGISEIELKCNDQISSYKQADLNKSPKLPYPDRSMDVVTCVISPSSSLHPPAPPPLHPFSSPTPLANTASAEAILHID
jgi:hypothetical protein